MARMFSQFRPLRTTEEGVRKPEGPRASSVPFSTRSLFPLWIQVDSTSPSKPILAFGTGLGRVGGAGTGLNYHPGEEVCDGVCHYRTVQGR
jgi:hypothetical protein